MAKPMDMKRNIQGCAMHENVFEGNVAMQVTQPVFLVAQLT